jgi:glucose/arabinose dehydrogenase
MRLLIPLLFLPLLCGCGGDGTAEPGPGPGPAPPPPPPPSPGSAPALEKVADGLDFPLYLTAPAGDPRLFVVEKTGRVRIVRGDRVLDDPFLDLSGQVSAGSEQGLLSMAFHPGYAQNGRFFVSFTNLQGDSRVVEHRVSADPDRADPNPVQTILAVDQPFSNHNGGLVIFGPDGKLYVGLGDGGSGGDPFEAGQDLGNLLGKILRLDVDAAAPYAIPADNPFVRRAGARAEVWAYGLRNPWRFSFDRATGDLYIADVGQNKFEEVNAVTAAQASGLNYGWNVMEGTHCFEPEDGCDRAGLTLPVLEYGHGEGCSVTGGYVYRGAALPDLRGAYFLSDFCTGFVRSFKLAGGRASDERRWPELEPTEHGVASFGEDAAGELYVLTSGGAVYKVVAR